MQRDFNKCGGDAFVIEVLETGFAFHTRQSIPRWSHGRIGGARRISAASRWAGASDVESARRTTILEREFVRLAHAEGCLRTAYQLLEAKNGQMY